MTAVVAVGAGNEILRARSAGPLRVMTPRRAGDAAWVVMSSLGGGLVDGDRVALDVAIDPGATCVVTTQASTKVYRGTSSQRLEIRVGDGATALVVPDPVVPYRGARFVQETHVELGAGASLVLVDVLTAGRVAFGERWNATIDSTLRISRGGVLLLHDRLRLGDVRGHDALGTVVLLGPLSKHRGTSDGLVAESPLGDGVMYRLAAERVELAIRSVRALAREACSAAGEDPWARKW